LVNLPHVSRLAAFLAYWWRAGLDYTCAADVLL